MSASVGGESVAGGITQSVLTPNQQLSQEITAALVVKGFVPADKQNAFLAKLASGQLKTEDWRTLVAATLRSVEPAEGGRR